MFTTYVKIINPAKASALNEEDDDLDIAEEQVLKTANSKGNNINSKLISKSMASSIPSLRKHQEAPSLLKYLESANPKAAIY